MQTPFSFSQASHAQYSSLQRRMHGIHVCLNCFNGGCLDNDRNHAQLHAEKSGHQVVLNIRRVPKPGREGEPPKKITKLAIEVEDEEEKFDYITNPKCLSCNIELDRTFGPLPAVIDGVMLALSAKKQSEVKAWEEETKPCSHTQQELVQTEARQLQSMAHCNDCDLNTNLWLCLSCGNLGCGRRQYDGSGGNNHAIEHFNSTRHPVCCKMGTITPEGTADLYCYAHDEAVLDPHLSQHLAHWGIKVSDQQKTEKSMAELQLDQNLKFDFSMTTEDGKQLEPVSGPGLTGLKNLGNSCYMASVIQSVFHLDSIRDRYLEVGLTHSIHCQQPGASCLLCQMAKLSDGLWSGRYSKEGVTPSMFKQVVGRDHPEFSTMRQQDAGEFMGHLLESLERREKVEGVDPTEIFKFTIEEKLQCQECKKVRYTQVKSSCLQLPVPALKDANNPEAFLPVTFEECLNRWKDGDEIEYACPNCNHKTVATKTVSFVTFPQVLTVWMYRFVQENWVPKKLNIPIKVPEDLNLDKYRSQPHPSDEELLPEVAGQAPQFNQDAMNQLRAMGFPEVRCQKALLATGNNNAEAAMNWLFEHMEDPDIDAPMVTNGSGENVSQDDIRQVVEMGFTEKQAKKALKNTNNNLERAVDWLFNHPDDIGENEVQAPSKVQVDQNPAHFNLSSFISHKGPSVHCGHYVAHVKEGERWILFNDEKVVHAINPPVEEAYIYTFQRSQ